MFLYPPVFCIPNSSTEFKHKSRVKKQLYKHDGPLLPQKSCGWKNTKAFEVTEECELLR